MARRGKFDPYGFPGLFDEIESAPSQQGRQGTPAPPVPGKTILQGGAALLGTPPRTALNPLGPVVMKPVPNKIMFMSFGSGSSGNCSYIGDSAGGIIVDAGVAADTVLDALEANNIRADKIQGILLTHDHSDHSRFAYALVRKLKNVKVYCTPRVLNGILRRHNITRRIKDYHHPIYKEIPFDMGNFNITAFEVMHDGTDNAGFFIRHDDRAFVVATDLGCISPRADFYMRQADYLMIESNYDLYMLKFGPYPEYLKARIQNVNGHLDNRVTADYLTKIYTPKLRYVFLCHLSHDNNTPEIAMRTSRDALEGIGLKVGSGRNTPADADAAIQLVTLPRFDVSPLYILRP